MNNKKNVVSAKLDLTKTKLRDLTIRTNVRAGNTSCDAGDSSGGCAGPAPGSGGGHFVQ